MGVVVEPTVLERPKYQNKPITSSANISYKASELGIIGHNYTLNTDCLWANFNTDVSTMFTGQNSASLQLSMSNSMPPNYQKVFDLTYIGEPVRGWPKNVGAGLYVDSMDNIQQGFYPDFELLPRLWETSSTGPLPLSYTKPIYGSVTYQPGDNGRFLIGPDPGVNYSNKFFSGSNGGNHPILYYMMKVWDKYYYYAKTGDYVHSSNPLDDTYSSTSVYLYKYIVVDEYYMRNLIYFTDLVYLSVYDSSSLSYTYDGGLPTASYLHKVNTFLNTPDQKVSNIFIHQMLILLRLKFYSI